MEQHEPELIDYLFVLWRWKWLVVTGTLAGVLLASVLTWSRAPMYRVAATIETGAVSDSEVDRIVIGLNLGSFQADQQRDGASGRAGGRVTAEYRKPVAILLTLDTDSPDSAVRVLDRTAGLVLDELTQALSLQRDTDELKLGGIRAEIERHEGIRKLREHRVEALRRSLDRLRKAQADASARAGDAVTALVFIRLSDEVTAREYAVAEIERELTVDLPRMLHELNLQAEVVTRRMAAVKRPRLAVAPERPQRSLQPRPRLNLAVGLTGGLLGSVLLALFVEYVRVSRRRRVTG